MAPLVTHREAVLGPPGLDRLGDREPADEHSGEADARLEPEVVGHLGPAQVGLQQAHPLVRLRQRDRQVDGRAGLALLGHRAGDDDGLAGVVDPDELQVGPQHPEGLDPRSVAVQLGDQRPLGRLRVVAHAAQHRALGHVGGVLGGLDRGVEGLAEHGQAHTQEQSQDDSEADVADGLRGDAACSRNLGLLDDW